MNALSGIEKGTPSDILRCDGCEQTIEPVYSGMLFWTPGWAEPSPGLVVAHKRCPVSTLHGSSVELWWLAEPEASLRVLAGLSTGYTWTAAQLRRLVEVAWAVPLVANEEQRGRAFHWHKQRVEMGW